MRRDGNTLSVVIREAWDTGGLHTLTKNDPITATDAHISIIGHITIEELLRHLDETEQALMDNSVNAVKGLIADLEKMGLL